jgi:ribonuclease HI
MKYYAVKNGRKTGIYYNWDDCKEQVDKFAGAVYKSFTSIEDANKFVLGTQTDKVKITSCPYSKDSINCDGSYSSSTEVMEFRIQDTESGELILTKSYIGGTNNIAEFLGLCYAMKFLELLHVTDKIIYTDSRTAMSWVRTKTVNTVFDYSEHTELKTDINECLAFIKASKVKFDIRKWDTRNWGENN